MNKNNLIIRLALIIASANFAPTVCSAQVQYTYDSSGNRITRTISLTARKHSTVTGMDEKAILDGGHTVSFKRTSSKEQLNVCITGLTDADHCSLLVCDLSGKQLHEQTVSSGETLVDFKGIRKGVCILYVELNGQKHSWKIQK